MAHQQAGNTVVREQQEYAAKHDIPGVFESLTIALLYKKPADPITFISEEAKRMAASKTYSATSVSSFQVQNDDLLCAACN